MPVCCAVGCSNQSGKPLGTTVHRIPRDKALRAEWVAAIHRENLPPTFEESSAICSAHFEEDAFQRNLQGEMGKACRGKLKADAVPSIFPDRHPPTMRTMSQYQERQEREDVSEWFW
ncbi:THAP domain-containing protein 1-like [Sycon ciliatum]|uniref:THAP domain-containing protein 1-like n=1 Tax=Sycon ciliatum TaxID=27933 RepID=UPI0031F5F35D